MKNSDIRYCECGCGRTLPDRYKGRYKRFYNNDCRKAAHEGRVNKYILGQ